MANLIQIKRSLNTASPISLANGEFAYTANGDVLFIGSNGNVVAIAGARTPGTLTANQALVANSSSAIDKVIVANAIVTSLSANGSYGSNGQVLVTNGTAIYWGTGTSGSNTQVQFNDSGVSNGSSGFTFNKTTNTLAIGNTLTVDTVLATTQVNSASHSVGSSFVANSTGAFTTGTVNAATLSVGGFVVGNTAGLFVSGGVNTAQFTVGSNFIANTTGVYHTGTVNAASHTVGSSVVANSSGVYTSGVVNAATVSVGSSFIANTSLLTVSTDAVLNNNVVIGDSSSDVLSIKATVNTNIMPTANVTYSVGNNLMRWNEGHFKNVHSVDGYFDGSVTISGNLVVSGNVTTTNVSSVVISDPLIYLAGNNYLSDLVDIGFAGNYYSGGVSKHTGLFRHASDDTYYLFKGLTQELDSVSVVNTADPTFAIADLKAYLVSGALVSNSTTVTITANSTVNVNITANTVTLASALAATSGGTGLNTFTSGDILVANTGNTLSKLGLGTSGYILQSNGTTLVYSTLDGGTF